MARRSKGDGGVYRATDGGWRGYVTLPNGSRKYVRAATKAEAEQKRKTLINQRDTTGISSGTWTLGEWLTHWINITADRHAQSTTHGYRDSVNRYLSDSFKHIRLDRLKIEHVEAEYDRLAALGLSGRTRHQVHAIVRVALKSARNRGHITFNPAAMAENKPKVERSQVTSLSESDVAAIESAAKGTRLEARWMLGLSLGLRPSEVAGLEWSALDWETGILTVGQQVQQLGKELILVADAKSESGNRYITVPTFLLELLREHRRAWLAENVGVEMWSPDHKPHSWMFTQYRRPGYPLSRSSDATSWRRLLEKAGVPHTRRYAARHTAASLLIAHGVDPWTVSEILGHSDATFTQKVYVHALAERKQQAALALDEMHRMRSSGTLSGTL